VTGPAWIYWLLSAVLLPGEPRKVAIGFDRVERAIHRLLKPRATPSTPPPTAAQRPERRVKDPRAVWLDTPAGGARRPSAMGRTQKLWAPEPPSTRTPPPAPIDRRTPTPT
jgi:hypothetical protein